GAPMDVLWFRLARRPEDAVGGLGRFTAGRLFILLNRGEYWQCGFVIAKGTIDEIRQAGLEAFRAEVARLAAVPRDRVSDIRSWDDVKLLTVLVDRLPTWYRSGLLCLGDAAHAMSPVGGVGINLATQAAWSAWASDPSTSESESGVRDLPSLTLIGQSLIAGLFTGGLYALLGLGLSLTWGLLRVINLANFALAFLGAYLTYQIATVSGVDPMLTLVVIVPGFFAAGVALEMGFLTFNINELTSLIVTFGLTVILESVIQWFWTADFRRL